MCVAVCPHGAIQVEGWRLDQFEAMVETIVANDPQTETLHA
jgi:heterodisulfide reductase subunit A-like polyferredoxin